MEKVPNEVEGERRGTPLRCGHQRSIGNLRARAYRLFGHLAKASNSVNWRWRRSFQVSLHLAEKGGHSLKFKKRMREKFPDQKAIDEELRTYFIKFDQEDVK